MKQEKLLNKNIIITAAADGIGLVVANFCIDYGANVFLTDIDQKKLSKLKNHPKYNKKLFIKRVKANNPKEVLRYFLGIKNKIRSIDALINNVGIAGPTGGSKLKPIGLVYIGVKIKKKIMLRKYRFKNKGRTNIQKATVRKILDLVLKLIK